jgi:hypothetical protein
LVVAAVLLIGVTTGMAADTVCALSRVEPPRWIVAFVAGPSPVWPPGDWEDVLWVRSGLGKPVGVAVEAKIHRSVSAGIIAEYGVIGVCFIAWMGSVVAVDTVGIGPADVGAEGVVVAVGAGDIGVVARDDRESGLGMGQGICVAAGVAGEAEVHRGVALGVSRDALVFRICF